MPVLIAVSAHNKSASVRVPSVVVMDDPDNVAAAMSASVGSGLGPDTYFYAVTALGSGGETKAIESSSVVIDADEEAEVTWDAVDGAVGYRVYRGTTTGTYTGSFLVTDNELTDSGQAIDTNVDTPPATSGAVADAGLVQLKPGVDTVVDLDQSKARKALNAHASIGQFVVTATNKTAKKADGDLVTLPANTA